jgi:hypothetical protein
MENIDFGCLNTDLPSHLMQDMMHFLQNKKKPEELTNSIARTHLEFVKQLSREDRIHGSLDNFIKMTLFSKECWQKAGVPEELFKYEISDEEVELSI